MPSALVEGQDWSTLEFVNAAPMANAWPVSKRRRLAWLSSILEQR